MDSAMKPNETETSDVEALRRVVFDLETDGLLDALTRIHSLSIRDLDSDTHLSCADQPGYTHIAEGLRVLREADLVVAHNGIKFDLPAIRILHPDYQLRGTLHDTMILTRFLWAHIKESDAGRIKRGKLPGGMMGNHSLEAWGYRLGEMKGEYTDWCAKNGIEDPWAQWSKEMQDYCGQDTLVTKALYLRCEAEVEARGNQQAADMEHELAHYLAAQERNGIPFDMQGAVLLQGKLAQVRESMAVALTEEFGTWYAANGQTIPKRGMRREGCVYTEGCAYTKLKLVAFNPGSRQHIARCLKDRYGWTPTEFTPSGEPKVDETTLGGLDYPPVKLLVRYLLVSKRLGQIAEGKQAWIGAASDVGAEGGAVTSRFHIHGSVTQNGAVTHRATHAWPNLAQVPAAASKDGVLLYGEDNGWGSECRELFTVPEGWVMLGADASGLELRCLAHYMAKYDGGAYGKIILEGDIHSANRDALGLEGKEGRDLAKRFIYAFLYGAGDVLLGALLEPFATEVRQRELGVELRKRFLKNLPALRLLIQSVQGKAKAQGYVLMPDGRRSYIRHQHAALNTLLQGSGAIICKQWIIEANRRAVKAFGPQGWRGQWAALLWVHDEIEWALRPAIAEEAKTLAVESIRHVTDVFNWRIPLDGDARLGRTWADVH
jgi:DNA polymerase I